MTGAVVVRPVRGAAEARAFLHLPARLGGEAAGWAVPLHLDTRRFFDPRANGLFQDHAVQRFLAFRAGRAVGRIAGAVRRGDGRASFGFLALERDAAVLRALLDAVAAWGSALGARRLRGPLNLTINHEAGALVDGFDRLPMVRMPRNPPWLPPMLEAVGLAAEKDVLACTLTVTEETHSARFAPLLAAWAGRDQLRIRPLDRRRYGAEIALVTDIFNDAWAENWGAVPVGPAEAATIASLMRPLLLTGQVFFAEWQGGAIGVLSLLPNIEEATVGLQGRLLPLGWWRVLRLLAGRCSSGRVAMLGVRRAVRPGAASAFAMGALLSAAIGHARARRWREVEFGWMLEDNHHILNAVLRLPAPVTGRWRLYGSAT